MMAQPTIFISLLLWSSLYTQVSCFNASAPVPWRTNIQKVDTLIESLTGIEKVALVHGSSDPGNQNPAGYIAPITRLGIPAAQLADGEAGINIVEDATSIPSQLNIAATWSRKAAYAAGLVTGREAALLNISVALAPRVNILRDPLTGNFWQSYSEDPFLNSVLGVEGVNAIQDQGTMANSKQIGPSSTGASSGDKNSVVDLQTLHEVYWAAIEAQVRAGAATLMCSYAQVNSVPACQYTELLTNTVREDWNFTGIVMSDWGATHSTSASIIAGMDLEMPSGDYFGDLLYSQVYEIQNVSETYLNRALGHILTKYNEFGLLNSKDTSDILLTTPLNEEVVNHSASIAYDIAVRSGVLLKNDNDVLPMAANASFGVFGPSGLQYTHGTGFAERAYGFTSRQLSALEALSQKTGKPTSDIPSSVGIDLQGLVIPRNYLLDLNGTPGLSRNDSISPFSYVTDPTVDFAKSTALPANRTYTWSGKLLTPITGYYRLSLQRLISSPSGGYNNSDWQTIFSIGSVVVDGTSVAAGYRLYLDGGARPWSKPIITTDGWDNIGGNIHLSAGAHNITATIVGILGQELNVRLCWVPPSQRELNIQKAESLAQTVSIPLVFAYANSPAQVGLQLDDYQDELITRISSVNPNTVVILHNSEPVLMPWLSTVSSVLWMGYPGQEGSNAAASLLLGSRNPQGHLPVTYPLSKNQTVTRNPLYPERVNTTSGSANFTEGVNSGYRWYIDSNTPTLFPFGFGLSYTTFSYSDLQVSTQNLSAEATVSASFTVQNSGDRAGVAVPQLYLGPPADAAVRYPGVQFAALALVGFEDVELETGESKEINITIQTRQLSFWDVNTRNWIIAKGTRGIYIGGNAEEKVLVGNFEL